MNKKCISVLLIAAVCLLLPVSALGEAEGNTGSTNPGGIEITVDGVPLEDVLGALSGMFVDELEKSMSEAVGEMNGIFSGLADDLSADLAELAGSLNGLNDEEWRLTIPELSVDEQIRRSAYDHALALREAQLAGNADKGAQMAKASTPEGRNFIIYMYDENGLAQAVQNAVDSGTLGETKAFLGSDDGRYEYRILSVLYLSPSEQPDAMFNQTDLSDGQAFEAYTDYAAEHAVVTYDEPLGLGGNLLTLVIWGAEEADWLMLVMQEQPFLLE